jgi:hypothetical protein
VLRLPSAQAPNAPPTPDWQARYDSALKKKRSGQALAGLGGTLGTAAIVLIVVDAIKAAKRDDCGNDLSCIEDRVDNAGLTNSQIAEGVLISAALTLGVVGSKRANAADRDIQALEAERAAAGGSTRLNWNLPLGHGTLRAGGSLHARMIQGEYRLRW